MSDDEVPVRSYYRSVTADGALWCESRDPDEVVRRSSLELATAEGPMTYQRFDVYEHGSGWRPWNPAVSDDSVEDFVATARVTARTVARWVDAVNAAMIDEQVPLEVRTRVTNRLLFGTPGDPFAVMRPGAS